MGKWKQVQAYAEHIPYPLEHLRKHLASASSILILDVTFTTVLGQDRAIFIAYDTTLGVVDYDIDIQEKKSVYEKILARLQQIGYHPICIVSDGNAGLSTLLEERHIPHQRCLTHLLRDLGRQLGKSPGRPLKDLDADIYRTMRNIWFTKTIEEIPEKINYFKRYSVEYFQKKAWLMRWFWKTLPNAILHLSYEEKIPYTTNILENLNGQIKQRIKTMRGLKSQESLHNFLKIFFYFRNYK